MIVLSRSKNAAVRPDGRDDPRSRPCLHRRCASRAQVGEPPAAHRPEVARLVHRRDGGRGRSSARGRRLAVMTSALVVTRDPVLLDELSRLVAAAGATPGGRRPRHPCATGRPPTLVLVGTDLAAELAGLDPPRRRTCTSSPRVRRPTARSGRPWRWAPSGWSSCPAEAAWLSGVMADLGEERDRPGRLVGVLGGSGGAGATTFACALGQVAARARAVRRRRHRPARARCRPGARSRRDCRVSAGTTSA